MSVHPWKITWKLAKLVSYLIESFFRSSGNCVVSLFLLFFVCSCLLHQRWANSVLMTEYEYEYYSTFQKWPNTNTNIIRFEKGDRIRIRILFGLKKATEYEYEYYSVWKNGPNTNTNIIWFEKIDRIQIRILFGLKISTEYEYEYYSAWKNHPNTNTNTSIRPQLFE